MKHLGTIAACLALAAISSRGFAASSPFSPEQERATFQLADTNLAIELVAAEPDVRAPVAIAWDADGRMFVAEMTDYPSGPVNGRIRLLEDRDGDGRYERAIVFATNLAFPNGVMPWKNGVLVTAAPDIWFLADTNGDGAADVREKILTGFAEGNQQLRINGLSWGMDNWIYGANGRSDGEAKWADGTPAASIRRRDFRFRPDTKKFEAVAGNSQFGMGHDDWGNRFPVFNATPIRHVIMEDRYVARQTALAGHEVVPGISPTNDGNRVFAVTSPNVLIPQPIGFFTSACGPSIYRGTALPDSYRGNYFVCEPVQNLVQCRVLKPDGSTFAAEYSHTNKDFLASSDPWFHGVFTATGPDGALYIVDFYRDLVEHPHWVAPELRDKVDWRKGEEHGRIWRIYTKGSKLAPAQKLSRVSSAQLVKTVQDNNGWTRDTAHRLLVERDAREVVPALEWLARKGATAQSRVHALNLLASLGATNSTLLASALGDSSPRVREHAVRLVEATLNSSDIEAVTRAQLLNSLLKLTADSDARVRLQLAATLGEVLNGERKIEALARLARHDDLDEWQSIAILSSAGPRTWPLLKRLGETIPEPAPQQLALLERAVRLVASGTNAEDKNATLTSVANWRAPERFILAAAFVESLPSLREIRSLEDQNRRLVALEQAAREAALDEKLSFGIRIAAVRFLAKTDSSSGRGTAQGDRASDGPLPALLRSTNPQPLQSAAARALIESSDALAIRLVFERWNDLSKPVRRQVVGLAARSRLSALELEHAAETGIVPLIEVDPVTRQALEKFKDAEVSSRATKLFAGAVSPDREAVVQKYRGSLKLNGERKHGAEIFERTCAVCHQMQGVGAKVGPDLSGTGQQPRETLLVQILDPSRQVLPDFVAYSAETTNGETYTGFVVNESATTVTLRRANEPDITLSRSELKDLKTGGKSLMPDGLEAGMSEQDVADLIEFLRRPDRTLFSRSQ